MSISKKPNMTLSKYMSMHKRNNNPEFTHTIIPNHPHHYGGSYNISDDQYKTFLDIYHHEVFVKNKECYLTEKHKDFSPVLIDLDFRFPLTIKKRIYTQSFIEEYLSIYMKEASSILDFKGHTTIFVLEKKISK